MSLREDIAAYFSILEPAREKRADEIINKVLDAAVNTCEVQLTYDEYDPARTFIEAINKLRSES